MAAIGVPCIIAQPRSSNVVDMLVQRGDGTFEVHVVTPGGVEVETVGRVCAAVSLSSAPGREAFLELPQKLKRVRYIGVGITEAGYVPGAAAIETLTELLVRCAESPCGEEGVCVISCDNVGRVGHRLRTLVSESAAVRNLPPARRTVVEAWLGGNCCFPNTMVDRITGHAAGDVTTPRCEPLPEKALVLEGHRVTQRALPLLSALDGVPGVVIRRGAGELGRDLAVKLRVANAVHTAMVYVMALSGLAVTARLGELPGLQTYLSQLFELDILPSLVRDGVGEPEARRFFTEWMGRLELPLDHSTFFVSQNAVAKVTERLVPTIASNGGKGSRAMVIALAFVLRFLTPAEDPPEELAAGLPDDVFVGVADHPAGAEAQEYTSGLRFAPSGHYTFRSPAPPGDGSKPIPEMLRGLLPGPGPHPEDVEDEYLPEVWSKKPTRPKAQLAAFQALWKIPGLSEAAKPPLLSEAASFYVDMVLFPDVRDPAASLLKSFTPVGTVRGRSWR